MISAILLAGGKSSRFGSDKRRICLDGESLPEKAARQLGALCGEVIVAGDISLPGCRRVRDGVPDQGPLAGILAGLQAAKGELCLIMACDMPFFPEAVARQLLALAHTRQAAVPRDGEKLQPLFAVVRRSAALPAAQALLAEGARAVRGLYEVLDTAYLDRADWADTGLAEPFFNINRPQDLERLQKML